MNSLEYRRLNELNTAVSNVGAEQIGILRIGVFKNFVVPTG